MMVQGDEKLTLGMASWPVQSDRTTDPDRTRETAAE
jgi:hypothetical protein